jgi:hypothetical protein
MFFSAFFEKQKSRGSIPLLTPARWWFIFAQPKGPTIMLEG